MRKLLSALLVSLILSAAFNSIYAQLRNPVVVTGKLIRITKALRDLKPGERLIPDVIVRDLDGIIGKDEAFEEGEDRPLYPSSNIFTEDPALQRTYPNNPHSQKANQRAIVANFNGIGYQPLNPPDPTLCAGPNHIIQMINGSSGAYFKVYNKTGGTVIAQTYLDAITGKGGLGDPICLYDQLADRFVLTEFANKPETGSEGLIVAVSQTPDPAGAWYVYFFTRGTTFPDYPKFSVWSDAYYATTNDFSSAGFYTGSSVYAFDKAKMLAGNATATMQRFTLGSASKHFSMIPVCLEGSTLPPAGSGGLIAYMQDDAWTSSTTDVDSIGMFEFKVDFANSTNTSINVKSSLAAVPYKANICTATRGQCITQPGTTTKLEALHQKIMNQPIYRNFSGYEGIVLSHVVDKGLNISGIRWYELRKTSGNWSIHQQSTYAPDNTNRWMPGVCYDKYGNIGLAYNVSSSATSVYPGARYTGRKECDPLNTMTYSEDPIIAGTASNASARYGDYSHLVCDPDGVTFWFTCEWNAASTWSTRIASFTLDPCVTPTCGDPTSLASSDITSTSATVSWAAVTNALNYDVDYKLTSSGTWTNAATATTLTSVNIGSLSAGTAYDWRVRANCTGISGNYVAAQFTTTLPCNAPAGLNTSSITTNSATVGWSAVTGANNYDVDYSLAGANSWTNAATATTSTSVNISGLSPSTLYDWRVRANCSSGSSGYSSAQFTTSAVATCDPPTGLVSSAITSNSATVTWSAVTGADNYDVDYSLAGANSWTNTATATTLTSVNISGLSPSTLYDWRVRTNCSSGSSGYSSAQFTTSAVATCDPPTGLGSSSITSNSATVAWSAVPGADNYDVDYSLAGAGSWTNAATATTLTTVNLSGLSPSTLYDWRVRANCSSGSSAYSSDQFTTAPVVITCPDQYEPNDNIASAKTIAAGVSITAPINGSGDKDYFSFSTSGNQKNIKVTLTNLPANYDLTLYNNNGAVIGTSIQTGTADETIVYNTNKSGTYKVLVAGSTANDFSAAQCYTLKVVLGNTTFTANEQEGNMITMVRGGLKLFPVPASTAVTISFDAYGKGSADIIILNQVGQQVLYKKVLVNDGINFNTIDVSTLKSGVYTVKVNNGKEVQTKKMIINK